MAKAKGSEASDVERLIEMGLNRYGAGDLDGAIFLWEEALAVDPDNQKASSYIDYVRLNFDVLTSEPSIEEPAEAPYAIEEEPEYKVDVTPGLLPPGEAAMPQAAQLISLDPVDDGWFADEATHDAVTVHRGEVDSIEIDHGGGESEGGTLDMEAEPPALEMEADEPPPAPMEMEADEPPPPPSSVDFDGGATRKFHGDVQETSEPMLPPPDDLDSDYGTAGPTTGFFRGDELSNGQTLGFFRDDESTSYQPRAGETAPPAKPRADLEQGELDEDPEAGFNHQGTPGFSNLETEIRKRDFGFVKPADLSSTVAPPSLGSARTEDKISFEATLERDPFGGREANEPADPSADDLLDSLPTPRPMGSEPESGEIRLSPSQTLDFPEASRVPASSRDTPSGALRASAVLSAPTREIGTRPGGRPLSNPDDDDAPTGQSDVRAIREANARFDAAQPKSQNDRTAKDIILDPIAAAAAQILDDIDTDAPSGESQDDQTRRRITRLLEKAGDWSDAGELDKAVSAVELALSEDPNSALAQKLITRNKETITNLFQAFLGDLDRTPQLAKPLHELGKEPISPRAAFLLSRIDGMLTIDELLDVSGMPRLEAYRHLCQLFLRGILR